jgi:acetyl-CoA synthetase
LLNGATTVIFEGTPIWPDAGRCWEIVDRLEVENFYTAPTALRAMMREGDHWLEASQRKTLRRLGSVGEPIDPVTWCWFHERVGRGVCQLFDTWWQTETGGILLAPVKGGSPKPGAACQPLPGIRPVLLDSSGEEIAGPGE